MSKRKADLDDESPHRKRKRLTAEQALKKAPKPEFPNIQSPKDLQVLLTFEQDAGPETRQRIQYFKLFLESTAYGNESNDRSAKRGLLLDYLQSQAPREDDEASVYLTDLTKTWHFAAQSNVESLFSSTAAVLALLLKTISGLIDFRACGNRLCKSLLQDNQVKLFDRAFSANKAKEHLISPCLRLLTEIVLFDGGLSARSVFRHRETTFKRLEIFLSMRKNSREGESENHKKPSIRNNALRYLYANLRLQNSSDKTSILAQGKVVRAMFDDILEDAPNVILEMLDVLKTVVASDGAITISAKGAVFSAWALGRLATLYSYPGTDNLPQKHESIQKSVHHFLLFLCTTPGRGVLDVQDRVGTKVEGVKADLNNGHEWVSSTPGTTHQGKNLLDGNERLSSFLQSLRPHASVLQSDLIIAVFRIKPEMVSDYFFRRQSFSFDPKATATWIGYSSFLLATVQLPLPESLTPKENSGTVPPQYATVMESILPQPLTQKAMTRCLNQSANLVKFLAIRILTAAFEKFAKVLRICAEVRSDSKETQLHPLWNKLSSKLTVRFCERIPEMGHVVAQFRNCPKANLVLRESITRLLALYYNVIPQVAIEEKFDISVALAAALTNDDMTGKSLESDGVRLLEIEHLLASACHSPDIEWFHKPGVIALSPFMRLLKLYLDCRQRGSESQNFRSILKSIVGESQTLNSQISLDVLVASLQDSDEWKASNRVFEFVDDCTLRITRKPIRYYDELANIAGNTGMNASDLKIDLLLIAVLEQWPFLVKGADPPTLANVSTWLVRYIEMIWVMLRRGNGGTLVSGNNKILFLLRDRLKAEVNDKKCETMFSKALKVPSELGISDELITSAGACEQEHVARLPSDDEDVSPKPSTDLVPPGPSKESEGHPGLNSWSREDVPDAISGGSIAALFLCLCSAHVEIRKQALGNMRTFMAKLESSGYSEWHQTFMLAGELAETAKDLIDQSPLPYFVGVLAAQLLSVVAQPLHLMYGKVNRFLNRGPLWTVTKLPSYWVDKILLNPPTEDDARYQEVEWLLDALVEGLRTPADFDIYRRCNIFERLLSFSASPSLPGVCTQKIIDLLFRCTYVEGSTTLITRCALMSWLSSYLTTQKLNDVTGDRLRTLATRVYETSDQFRVNEWSDGTLRTVVDRLLVSNNG